MYNQTIRTAKTIVHVSNTKSYLTFYRKFRLYYKTDAYTVDAA
jgi:hypothetical protein